MKESALAPVHVLQAPVPLATAQEGGPDPGKSASQSSQNTDIAPTTSETPAAKSIPGATTTLPRAADGSAMAALNAPGHPVEAASAVAPAPPPAPTPPRSTPVLQVGGSLRWMLKGGIQEAQLQLHPDSLGQVTIHLRVEGGEVHARLWITEPASVQAIQEGRPHLEQSLKEQGLQLGSFDLQQGHRPHQEAAPAPTLRETPVLNVPLARQEAPAAVYPTSLNPHHVELYA